MLHSLKANLVNLQDENKPTLHADCYISTSPVESESYIPDAWAVACFSPRVLPEPAFIRQVDGPRFFYNSRYMGYNEFILIVNAASVIILLVMALLLCLAARFKGESSYAAMIIVVSTVPVYIYNVCRSLQLYEVAIFFAPIALFERYRKDTVTTTVTAEAEAEFIATEVKPQPQSEADNGKEEMQKLEQYARQVEEYLRTSEVYVNPNLSLKDVATATGISSKNLSKSINATLGKNFFDNSVMSVRQWLAVMSVMIIPVVNVVMIFWWAFAEKELTNSNKVNWARASVILLTAFVIAVALLGGILLFGWYIQNH